MERVRKLFNLSTCFLALVAIFSCNDGDKMEVRSLSVSNQVNLASTTPKEVITGKTVLSQNAIKPASGLVSVRLLNPAEGSSTTDDKLRIQVQPIDESGKPADHELVASILFQYRPILTDKWTDIMTAGNTTNPVTGLPFGLFWDVSNLSGGKYAIRAVLTTTGGYTDENPPEREIWITRPKKPRTLIVGISINGDEGEVFAKEVRDTKFKPIDYPLGGFLVEAFGDGGQLVAVRRLNDPRLVFTDKLDPETGEMSGGQVWQESAALLVSFAYTDRISYLTITGVPKGQFQQIGPIQLR